MRGNSPTLMLVSDESNKPITKHGLPASSVFNTKPSKPHIRLGPSEVHDPDLYESTTKMSIIRDVHKMPFGLQALMPDVGRRQPVCNGTRLTAKAKFGASEPIPAGTEHSGQGPARHGLKYYVRIRVDGQLQCQAPFLGLHLLQPRGSCGTCASASWSRRSRACGAEPWYLRPRPPRRRARRHFKTQTSYLRLLHF